MSYQKFASRAASAAFVGALAMGLAMAAHAGDGKQPMEKCFGVAKQGRTTANRPSISPAPSSPCNG
jgi:uncharacterized membrane protein